MRYGKPMTRCCQIPNGGSHRFMYSGCDHRVDYCHGMQGCITILVCPEILTAEWRSGCALVRAEVRRGFRLLSKNLSLSTKIN